MGGGVNCVKTDDLGRVCLKEGYYSHEVSAGSGKFGWIRFCNIEIIGNYQNCPLTFEVDQRDRISVGKLSLKFYNNSTTTVGVESFIKDQYIIDAVVCPVGEANSSNMFELYIKKAEHYDAITFRFTKSQYMSYVKITWTDEYVEEIETIPNFQNAKYAELLEITAKKFHGIADNAYGFYDHCGLFTDYITKSYIGGDRENSPDWLVSVKRIDEIKERQLKAVAVGDLPGILKIPELIKSTANSLLFEILFNITSIVKTVTAEDSRGYYILDLSELTGLKEIKTVFVKFENESIYKLLYDGTINGYPSLTWTSIIGTKPSTITLLIQRNGYGIANTKTENGIFSAKYIC